MADESDDAEVAADRLEVALERIAQLTEAPLSRPNSVPEGDLSVPEIAERLDLLIGRLRAALGAIGDKLE